MLDVVLTFFKNELNAYLQMQTGVVADTVRLNRVVDDAGKYALDLDSIGISIVNIEEERVLKEHLPEYTYINGQHVVLQPKLKLNLTILIAAHFKFYDQALKHLAHVLTFFQGRNLFVPAQYPGLDSRIERLTVELQSLSYDQLNQIWAFIGGKQLPSAVYRVRMAVLQDTAQTAVQPPLTSIDTRTGTL